MSKKSRLQQLQRKNFSFKDNPALDSNPTSPYLMLPRGAKVLCHLWFLDPHYQKNFILTFLLHC